MPDDTQDDDDTGRPIYWLKYKVWGVPGWLIAVGVLAAGFLLGKL